MTREDYEQYKDELMRRKTYPYTFTNLNLATEFFAIFQQEVPTARMYQIGGTVYVTRDWQVETRLVKLLQGYEAEYKRKAQAVADVRRDVEASIRGGDTRI